MTRSFFKSALLAITLVTVSVMSASAHKVIIGLYVEGNAVEGEVGFSNGDMAKNIPVEIFDKDGNKLGETTTDEEGVFLFTPTSRVDLHFKANLGQGHIAQGVVPADDLSATLGGSDSAVQTSSTATPSAVSSTSSTSQADVAGSASKAELEAMIAKAVARGVKPLRKDLLAFEDKQDLQRILGGIGYIAGLFGLGFYLAARRKLADASKEES